MELRDADEVTQNLHARSEGLLFKEADNADRTADERHYADAEELDAYWLRSVENVMEVSGRQMALHQLSTGSQSKVLLQDAICEYASWTEGRSLSSDSCSGRTKS